MLMTILNVVYVLLAVAMIVLILMQRGAGAQAGSGFGAGASATVFGARGAGNFLSKTTKWLAIVFFGISLFMGWHVTHSSRPQPDAQQQQQNLGLMSDVPVAPAATATRAPASAVPAAPAAQAPASAVPTVPAQSSTVAPANGAPSQID